MSYDQMRSVGEGESFGASAHRIRPHPRLLCNCLSSTHSPLPLGEVDLLAACGLTGDGEVGLLIPNYLKPH